MKRMNTTGQAIRAPKVSVIVPAYNVAPYIGEALASVEAQTYRDFETIVVNDGSPDDTEKALAPYMKRIVYVRQENRGLSGARNTGMRLARGRYFALLDADDMWMPDYLERMVEVIEGTDSPDIVYPNAELFGMKKWEGRLYQDIYPSVTPVTLERLLSRECTVFVSALFRREAPERIGMFDEAIRGGGEDFDMWLRAAWHGLRFAYTARPLVRYRKRPDSLSGNEARMSQSLIYICDKFLAEQNPPPDIVRLTETLREQSRAALNRALAKQKIEKGEFAEAVQHLSKANAHFRSVKLAVVGMALRFAPEMVARLMKQREDHTQLVSDPGNGPPGLRPGQE
ncbi:MAG: glycosyltransferase family 2 protein [Blastocatellia bacterium]